MIRTQKIVSLLLVTIVSLSFAAILMTLVASNTLWTVYFFFMLAFGLVLSLSPSKQKLLISLFTLTIPINVYKHLGDYSKSPNGHFLWKAGLKGLAYFSINEVLD